MSGWAGFSDDELRKMQLIDSAGSAAPARGRKPVPASRNRQQLQRERALQLAAQRAAGAGETPPALPAEQQLTQPLPREKPRPTAPSSGAPAVKLEAQPELGVGMPGGKHLPPAEEPVPALKELEKQEVEVREKTRLEQLQLEQKVMEEMNKRKKALLTKTIAEKSKQTQAEALKLKRIQKELQTLDDMVSNDIGILRGRIEQASWDYSAARKRYEKAEAEYVTSKLDLHRKTEVKEQLTEHLCAIIQQNEQRKARKLEELMEQLQATEEGLEGLREEEEEEKKEEEENVKAEEEVVENGSKEEEEKKKEEDGSGSRDCAAPSSEILAS